MATTPRFLIKKSSTTSDIYTAYGLRVVKFPYLPINSKPKNIAKRTYYDQTGDYLHFPTTITYEGIEFTVRFAYKGAKDAANTNITNFITYISGVEISIYSEYLKVGRQRVRVIEINNDPAFYRDSKKDVVEFDITFKTEDPNTNITLTLA